MTRRILFKKVNGHSNREKSKMTWMHSVRHDICIKNVNTGVTAGIEEWKKKL